MILIIDEWLWHDLAGENREEKQKEAFRFLECIFKICDKIAIMENSPFIKKFWQLLNALTPMFGFECFCKGIVCKGWIVFKYSYILCF